MLLEDGEGEGDVGLEGADSGATGAEGEEEGAEEYDPIQDNEAPRLLARFKVRGGGGWVGVLCWCGGADWGWPGGVWGAFCV